MGSTEKRGGFKLEDRRWRFEREREGLFMKDPRVLRDLEPFSDRDSSEKKTPFGSLLPFSFFFFKQKTAYEILRSDWSSDVCSSDLPSQTSTGDLQA